MGQPRFSPKEPQDKIIIKFKNLFSSLTALGEFEIDVAIKENGSGEDNAKQFFWKGVKLNLNTATEKLLNNVLEAYRAYKAQENPGDFFDSPEFAAAVNATKARYNEGFMTSKQEVERVHAKLDHIAKFIKGYMKGEVTQMPKPDTDKFAKATWAATFFGGKKAVEPVRTEDADMVPSLKKSD